MSNSMRFLAAWASAFILLAAGTGFVRAEDIANAIVFLASPMGANISGHALPVDADAQSLA